jgi:hypothetical protein
MRTQILWGSGSENLNMGVFGPHQGYPAMKLQSCHSHFRWNLIIISVKVKMALGVDLGWRPQVAWALVLKMMLLTAVFLRTATVASSMAKLEKGLLFMGEYYVFSTISGIAHLVYVSPGLTQIRRPLPAPGACGSKYQFDAV